MNLSSIKQPGQMARLFLLIWAITVMLSASTAAATIELKQAWNRALHQSSRGAIIEGDYEVVNQEYNASRINFLLPRVSINGSLPAYSVNESFRFFGGASQKSLFKTTDFDFNSSIQLDQSLITGGDISVTANLTRNDARYPNTLSNTEISELSEQGFFNFRFVQPLLKPSDPKFELKNKKDDLHLARIKRHEEEIALKAEVTEAFMGVLEMSVRTKIANDKVSAARTRAAIDTIKYHDGIISEEEWLQSTSTLLDAELEKFDIENKTDQQQRALVTLLDAKGDEKLEAVWPEAGEPLSHQTQTQLTNNWMESLPLKKAEYEYSKKDRSAGYAASSYGLTGNLSANYSLGRGKIKTEGFPDDNIKTNSWGVSLNLTYPLWDGGASGAAVKAAHLAAEKSLLEFQRTKNSVRADMIDIINRIDISHRKLQVLKQQIGLSENRLSIAKFRFDDGQISKTEFLDVRIIFQETRIKYLEELKNYFLARIELEGKYFS